MRRSVLLLVAGGALALALGASGLAIAGCGGRAPLDGPTPNPMDGGDGRVEARAPIPTWDANLTPDIDAIDGWQQLDAYDAQTAIYYPTSRASLPPPMEWEPCETIAGDAGLGILEGMGCRRLVPNWKSDGAAHVSALVNGAKTARFVCSFDDSWDRARSTSSPTSTAPSITPSCTMREPRHSPWAAASSDQPTHFTPSPPTRLRRKA